MRWLLLLVSLMFALPAEAQAVCVNGVAGVKPTATVSWVAPTLNTDGTPVATPVSYNIYQGATSGSEIKVANVTTLSSVITSGLLPGFTFYWFITVVDAKGVESAHSNEVCKVFPASVPNTVTVTIN